MPTRTVGYRRVKNYSCPKNRRKKGGNPLNICPYFPKIYRIGCTRPAHQKTSIIYYTFIPNLLLAQVHTRKVVDPARPKAAKSTIRSWPTIRPSPICGGPHWAKTPAFKATNRRCVSDVPAENKAKRQGVECRGRLAAMVSSLEPASSWRTRLRASSVAGASFPRVIALMTIADMSMHS